MQQKRHKEIVTEYEQQHVERGFVIVKTRLGEQGQMTEVGQFEQRKLARDLILCSTCPHFHFIHELTWAFRTLHDAHDAGSPGLPPATDHH